MLYQTIGCSKRDCRCLQTIVDEYTENPLLRHFINLLCAHVVVAAVCQANEALQVIR